MELFVDTPQNQEKYLVQGTELDLSFGPLISIDNQSFVPFYYTNMQSISPGNPVYVLLFAEGEIKGFLDFN